MRKNYVFLLMICPLFMQAQITITSADLPAAGVSFINARDSGYTAAIPAGGANQTWNYSSLLNLEQDTTAFIQAAGTQGASLFPAANLATYNAGSNSYTYFISNNNGFFVNGATNGPLGGVLAYNPPMTYVPTPFTYGNTHSDYARIQVDSGSGPAVRFIVHIQSTFTADGWGSLQLPNATYPNTLRVKVVQVTTDSIMYDLLGTGNYVMFGNPTVSQSTTYDWFKNGTAALLLGIDADSVGNTATTSQYLINYTVGIPQLNAANPALQVSPNPAMDKVHIIFPQTIKSEILRITDSQGKLVDEIAVSQNDVWLDVNKYKAGWYFLSIKNDDQVYNAKLLIDKGN